MRQAGERIGEWIVDRYLSSGGMGDVYVGHHAESGEEVALKLLAQDSDAALVRFGREWRITRALEHPHIVQMRGHGTTEDGHAFIAMELLRGLDLEQRLRRDPPSPAATVAIVSQITRALEAAHAARVVHRDLKPQNVFLCHGPSLHVKVLDFGIARLTDDSRLTHTGTIVGTLAYIAPEQARGQRDIDHRADLWSLGVLLHQGLTGALPFAAPSGPGTLYKILFETPPDLGEVRPDLPVDLVELVRRCLSKQREDRPTSAAALRAALEALDADALGSLPAPRAAAAPGGATAPSGEAVQGDDATLVSAGGSPTDEEVRLTAVAYLHRVRDARLLEEVARELEGRLVPLAGRDAMVLFGLDRWNGDEPHRALRLAVALAAEADAAGVATGRALRGGEQVAGDVIDEAVALARRGGIRLDATSAAVVRADWPLQMEPDGSARVEAGARARRVRADREPWDTPFVGREAELALLVRSRERSADATEPAAVAVFGASGMGKSRLLAEALEQIERAQPGAVALTASCEAFRRDTPFAALIDALSPVADPSLLRLLDARRSTAADPAAFLDRARTTVESILRHLAEAGPVVLALDDAQWLDPTTRAALRWVCDNAWDLPLALWLFSRPEGRRSLDEVTPALTHVDLFPLPRAAAEQVLGALAGAAPAAILERAAGHPLFLEELGRLYAKRGEASAASAELPPSIEGAHLTQLDQLDPLDREFVKRAAVFGRTAWIEGVAQLGGDPGAVPRLRRAGLVAPRSRSRLAGAQELTFRSQTMQEVAYGLWPEAQRRRLHQQAAAWLSDRAGAAAEELARHWELAGEAARAAACYAAAAEATVHVGDSTTARGLADRALSLAVDPAVRWRAARVRDSALLPSGDQDAQRRGLEELEALAAELGLAERAEAAARWCGFARVSGDRDGCIAQAGRALALARELGSARFGSRIHNELALLYANEGRFEEASSQAERARSMAAEADDPWLVARVQGVQGYVRAESGRALEALPFFEASAAGFARAGDRHREAVALANAGDAMLQIGRLAEAREVLEQAVEGARRVGNPRTVAVATANLGIIARLDGAHGRATEILEQCAGEAARIGHTRLVAAVTAELAYLTLAHGGTPAALRERAARALDAAEAARSPGLVASGCAVALRARRAAGDDPAELAERLDHLLPALEGQARAEALLALGRHREASDALDALAARLSPDEAPALRDILRRRAVEGIRARPP